MIGKKLKMLRGNRTQEEVSVHLELPRARYSHYENDRTEPDYKTLIQLADYFNVSIDFLFGRTDKISLTEQQQHHSYFILNSEGLSEEDIKFVKYTADYLKQKNKCNETDS